MPQIERFAVGSIECQIVPDGAGIYEPDGFAVGVPVGQIRAALTARAEDNGQFAFPYNCLLIRSGGRIALVDTGMGAEQARHTGEPGGRLMDSLAASGITADQVDLVIISLAPGHTPGHTVVALTSGHDGALYLGDAVLDEANFAHPGWVAVVEWNFTGTTAPGAVNHTRSLRRAASSRCSGTLTWPR